MSLSGVRWLLIGSVLLAGSASAEEEPACRSYLVPCNIGQHYSGTLHWSSVLAWPGEKVTEAITVHVTRGKVRCEGTVTSTGSSAETGPIRGEGLLAVEWGKGTDDDPDEPWYRISVACPDIAGPAPTDVSGGLGTYKQPRRKGFAVLEGATEWEHPDADAVNGVTGTQSLKWSFSLDR